MSDAIIVALIGAVATIFGQYLLSKKQREEDKTDLAVTLKGISDRLDEHNNYAARIGGLANDISEIKDDMTEYKADMRELKTDMAWVKNEVQKK